MVVGTDRSVAVLVREGTTLRLGAEVPLPAGVRALAVTGGQAWLACEDDRLRVVDVRDPSAPQVIASEALAANGIEVSGGVLIASTPEGLVTRRLPEMGASGPALVVPRGNVALDDAAKGLTAFRRGVLVAAGLTGAQFVSLDDATHPVRIRQAVVGLALRQVERTGQDVFTLDGQSLAVGVERTDGRIDRDTTRTSRLAALGNTERFAVSPRRLWTVSGGKVSSVELPAAEAPASLLLGSATVDVSGDEQRAVVAMGAAGAAVVGVDAAGTLRRAALMPDTPTSAVALDGALALLGGPSGLAVVDVSDVRAPVRLTSVPTAGPVRRVRLAGRLALVSQALAGVELWDVTQPAAPVLLGTLPAPRAEDAILAAGHVVVSDGIGGVKTFPLPAAAIGPVARLLPGVAEVEPGAALEIAAVASGVGVDDAELLLGEQVLGPLDEAGPRARFRVPLQATDGHELSFLLRVRSATDAESLSAPRRVRVTRASALPSPPTIALSGLDPNQTYTAASGAMFTVSATYSGGMSPLALRARWAGHELGPLPILWTGYASGLVRLPVVAAETTGPLEVVLVDAAGRAVSVSTQLRITAPGAAPTAPTGLPTTLYAGPYINSISLNASGGGAFSLRLELNGSVVGRAESNTQGSLNLPVNLVLPSELAGTQVTLAAVTEDALGRQARTERVYTVLPDTWMPTVSLSGLVASVVERTTRGISLSAQYPPGHHARSLRLLANGVEIASTSGTSLYKSYTFPSAAQVPQILFEAVATDHLGREGRVSSTVNVLPDLAPQVDAWVQGEPLLTGAPFSVCGKALDDVQVTSARLLLGQEVVWQCNAGWWSCATSGACFTRTMPIVSSVEVRMEATDSAGQTSSQSRTYPVAQDQPPIVRAWASREPLFVGAPFEACVNSHDDLGLTNLKLKVGETIVWQCTGTGCSNPSTRCVEATAPEADIVVLSAEATDSSGRTTATSRSYTVEPDRLPEVEPWAEGKPLTAGMPYPVCAKALDDVKVSNLKLRVGEGRPGSATARARPGGSASTGRRPSRPRYR